MATVIVAYSSSMPLANSCAAFPNHPVRMRNIILASNSSTLQILVEFLSLQVPHAITLLEHLDLLCIADRENMRVVCPK